VHGINFDNSAACCKEMATHGLVDCVACLDEAWATFSDMLDPESRMDATWLLDTVRQARDTGVRKSDLLVRLVFLSSLHSTCLEFISTSLHRHPLVPEFHACRFSSINYSKLRLHRYIGRATIHSSWYRRTISQSGVLSSQKTR